MEKVEEKKVGQKENIEETIVEPAVEAEKQVENPKIEEINETTESEAVEVAVEPEVKEIVEEAVVQETAQEIEENPAEVAVTEETQKTEADTSSINAGFEDEQLEQLLEESLGNIKNLQLGDKVEGEIINITDSFIFVSLGGKRDAYAEKVDYLDKEGNVTCKVGDTLSGYVVKYTETETFIAKSLVSVNKRVLKEAFEEEIPVNGKVTAFTKGGFIVDVSGVRTFCPKSHIDTKKAVDVKLYVGKNYDLDHRL